MNLESEASALKLLASAEGVAGRDDEKVVLHDVVDFLAGLGVPGIG